MLGTRPDISFAVTKMAQHAANPDETHLEKALYIIRYLNTTSNYKLVYSKNGDETGVHAHTDSDWASEKSTSKSTTGFMVNLANGIILWKSVRQTTIALSSTEAEYMAMSDCAKQLTWIHQMINEIGFPMKTLTLRGDNQGSIFMAQNPITNARSKHINIRVHHIREKVDDGLIRLEFIEGTNNPADMFTKNLARPLFEKHRSKLGLVFTHKH